MADMEREWGGLADLRAQREHPRETCCLDWRASYSLKRGSAA